MPVPASSGHPPAPAAQALSVRVRGAVTDPERDDAAAIISGVLAQHGIQVDQARLRISSAPCPDGPGLAQINLHVGSTPARVQVAGRSVPVAVSTVASRLHDQIDRLAAGGRWPWPDPRHRPLALPGPAPIRRHKPVRLDPATADQAVAVLDAMDYDAYLFADADTGEDTVVFRAGPTGLRLCLQATMRPPAEQTSVAVAVHPHKTPALSPAQAVARAGAGCLPWLFFTDPATSRGNLLYRRYDATFGLITPPADDRPTETTGGDRGPIQ